MDNNIQYSGCGTRAGTLVFCLLMGAGAWIFFTNGDIGWGISCAVFALAIAFMELTFPAVGKAHPPRNAEEAYQDKRKFENRNAWGWLLVVVVAIAIYQFIKG